MAKPCLAAAIIAIMLPLFFAVPATAESIGLGISDLNLQVDLKIAETKQIQIARVYNTGELDLNVTSTWVPNYYSFGILVELVPNTLYLAPKQSAPVYLKVTARDLGEYSGYVDFNCDAKLPENLSGNPTAPGGRAHASFNITEGPPTSSMPAMMILIETMVVIVTAIGISILLHRYVRKRQYY
jgi:hypothetical protein